MFGFLKLLRMPNAPEPPNVVQVSNYDKVFMYFMSNAPEMPDWYKTIADDWYSKRLSSLYMARRTMSITEFEKHIAELNAERYFEWTKYYATQQVKRIKTI